MRKQRARNPYIVCDRESYIHNETGRHIYILRRDVTFGKIEVTNYENGNIFILTLLSANIENQINEKMSGDK